MKRMGWLLLSTVAVLTAHAQAVVVNEYLNQSSSTGEFVELKVLADGLELGGYRLRDFTGSGSLGGTITFSAAAPLWQNVRAGYLIVIEMNQGTSADVDFSDGVVVVGEEDAALFSATGSFTILAGADGVQLLDAQGATGNHVHILYHGTPDPGSAFEAAAATSPGARAGGALGSGEVARFVNTDEQADFGDDDHAVNSGAGTATQGAPNDAVQAAYCAALLPLWINEVLSDAGSDGGPLGTDQGEFVELAGPVGLALGGYEIEITNCTGTTYTHPLGPFAIVDDGAAADDGFGFFVLADQGAPDPGDQDLPADGIDTFGEASEHIPDGTGAVLLRNSAGDVVFAYAYGAPLTCPGLAHRGLGDLAGPGSVGFVGASKPAEDADGTPMVSSPGVENAGQQLPVELIAFEALLDGAAVLLRWETASETNNAGFEVQRRGTGAWRAEGVVEGQGTTSEAQHYRFTVAGLPPGQHVFRLKQIDYDGTFAYSPVVEVAVGVPGAFQLSNPYPNPFAGRLHFSLGVARAQPVEVAVFDAAGRRVATLFDGPMAAGQAQALTFDARGAPPGLYLIRVRGAYFLASRAVVRIR
ncbi:MAG: hypothetical protein R3247_04235 [Rhodothermales bacterium]|nr:hypothetical protein [Rhodothermales bacterium]